MIDDHVGGVNQGDVAGFTDLNGTERIAQLLCGNIEAYYTNHIVVAHNGACYTDDQFLCCDIYISTRDNRFLFLLAKDIPFARGEVHICRSEAAIVGIHQLLQADIRKPNAQHRPLIPLLDFFQFVEHFGKVRRAVQ